jgi:hypothetical protein
MWVADGGLPVQIAIAHPRDTFILFVQLTHDLAQSLQGLLGFALSAQDPAAHGYSTKTNGRFSSTLRGVRPGASAARRRFKVTAGRRRERLGECNSHVGLRPSPRRMKDLVSSREAAKEGRFSVWWHQPHDVT